MITYTIKKKENGGIFLVGEDGVRHGVIELIRRFPAYKVFAFDAPMGAGKTTMIKQLCEELGTSDVVNSPTFAIINVYDTPNDGPIYHFDCYRLKDIVEAQEFGAEEYLYSGNLCLIEWPDIIRPLLPEDTLFIRMHVKEDGDREMIIED